ncbi:uncharacterized protein LOC123321141 [Coccinella septempunctata]|uniref:uncharacterized protein LOC123321141 n=1 Tax=Coccinella septempunctata TaxID=41139 RepID=UPI001D07ADC0|nr:uncharacterized protein LOC123321141 [Coccinella septempunctata]
MSLKRNDIQYPPRTYKTVKQLSLPENRSISVADIDSLNVIHEKVHAPVEGSKIVEFYNGKSVLLTGGTGFIGKLMTEKLLRTCSGIDTLYLLVRPKRGKNAETRLDDTFDDEIFSELKKAQPKFRHKVVPIQGDVSLPSLGITIEDRQKLIEKVNIIIHGAATVRFDEPLRRATAVHVSGTKEIMTLAQQCKNLVSLVHISTAYSQCAYKEIREEFYDPVYMTEPFLKMIETNSDKYLNKNQTAILRGWPNTYSFTKAIAEHTVRTMANDIPTAICRPGIVTSTYKEPLRSWIDNLYGPMGAIVGAGTGLLRTFHLDEEKVADLIPGDYVANGIIAAAYNNQFNEKGVVKIYNNISSAQNPITWGDFTELAVYYGLQNPTMKSIWYYCNTLNKNRYIHFLFEFFLHLIPALLIDGYLTLIGKKRRMVNIYKKIHKFSLLLSYFSLREWKMHNKNLQDLWSGLSDKDKEIFEFSMAPEDFNWNSYISILGGGVRLYLLKDKMETIPAAKRKYKRLYYLHNAFKAVTLLIALRIAVSILNTIVGFFHGHRVHANLMNDRIKQVASMKFRYLLSAALRITEENSAVKMSFHKGEIQFPPKAFKTLDQLLREENKHLWKSDVDHFYNVHQKVHAPVAGSKIVEFFNGKTVFLTGGTGFIGKLIVEKLLRSCAEMDRIFLLVRPKKGKDVQTRLETTFSDPVFSELKKVNPNFLKKVTLVQGDCSEANLGLSSEDRQKLIENVNVIIHGAATVRFDEPLRIAAAINVKGTIEIMRLAQQCQNLVSMVHISTAYSQCVLKEVREHFYPPPMETEQFLKFVEEHSDKYMEENLETILKGWPNTYTFTKAIGEMVVKNMVKDIPTAICRPSIVMPTFEEPIRSWTDNFNGPIGMSVGAGIGVLRTALVDLDKVVDLIPGDFIANGVIAAAYQNQFNEKGKIQIYNLSSSSENPITWRDLQDIGFHYGLQNPSIRSIWYVALNTTTNKYFHYFMEFFLHLIPGLLMDVYLALMGKKTGLLKLYKKYHEFSVPFSFFSFNEWKMHSDNTQKLWKSLSPKDKEVFEFNMAPTNFSWNEYMITMGLGIRQYVLKEEVDTIPAARKKFQRFYYMHNILKAIVILVVLKLVMAIINALISIFT